MAAPETLPMPPTMTTIERGQQVADILPRRDRKRRAADHAGEARQPRAQRED